jgi:hypothetical protein
MFALNEIETLLDDDDDDDDDNEADDEADEDDEEEALEVEVVAGRAAREATAPAHSDMGLPAGQHSCSPLALLAQ